jgi:hypothetical protein
VTDEQKAYSIVDELQVIIVEENHIAIRRLL